MMLLICVSCAGCQIPTATPDQDRAMTSLWHWHQACLTTQDRDHLRRLSDELHRMALQETAGRAAIPGLLRSLVAAPPVRTAIDPKAVAAACLARAGSLAQAVGDEHEAERVRHVLVEHYGGPDYGFYLNLAQGQAKDLDQKPRHSAVGPDSAGWSVVPIADRTLKPMR